MLFVVIPPCGLVLNFFCEAKYETIWRVNIVRLHHGDTLLLPLIWFYFICAYVDQFLEFITDSDSWVWAQMGSWRFVWMNSGLPAWHFAWIYTCQNSCCGSGRTCLIYTWRINFHDYASTGWASNWRLNSNLSWIVIFKLLFTWVGPLVEFSLVTLGVL